MAWRWVVYEKKLILVQYNKATEKDQGAQFTRKGSMWTPDFWKEQWQRESNSTIQREIYPLGNQR